MKEKLKERFERLIAGINRELGMRYKVYPYRIRDNKLGREKGIEEIKIMYEVRANIEFSQKVIEAIATGLDAEILELAIMSAGKELKEEVARINGEAMLGKITKGFPDEI